MLSITSVTRYHDISCGHRVVGHEGKCRGLHGHNYRIHFECVGAKLDTVGRVIDFSVIKDQLCEWLEDEWDHKMLLWKQDPLSIIARPATGIDGLSTEELNTIVDSFVVVPFNPTAENMAEFLLHTLAPAQLRGSGIVCRKIIVEETRKCSASVELAAGEIGPALLLAKL